MDRFSGMKLAQYTVGDLIGGGGVGMVYIVAEPKTSEMLAIKVLRAEFVDNPEILTRFEREAYLLMQLDHPHIVPVYDFGQVDGVPFLVMRLVRGPTVAAIARRFPFSPAKLMYVISPLAAALDYAHGQGVIHRDLKPGNVLIDTTIPKQPRVYLTDFGLSKIKGSTPLTITGQSLGTPHYMSPEQVLDHPLDRRSDVYSLGVLIYQLLLGRLPFEARQPQQIAWMHVKDNPPPPTQLVANFPRTVSDVLLRALAKSPKDRYETAGAFAKAYAQAAQAIDSAARTTVYARPPVTADLNADSDAEMEFW